MIPIWAKLLPWPLIMQAATTFNMDSDMIAAVIQTESSGNKYAVHYEPKYSHTWEIRTFAELLGTDMQTLERIQKTSYGLMQVMGAVSFEHGIHKRKIPAERWPTAMLEPRIGIHYGVKHLKEKFDKYGPDPAKVYAAYNAGSLRFTPGMMFKNQGNVDRFMRYYRELKKLK